MPLTQQQIEERIAKIKAQIELIKQVKPDYSKTEEEIYAMAADEKRLASIAQSAKIGNERHRNHEFGDMIHSFKSEKYAPFTRIAFAFGRFDGSSESTKYNQELVEKLSRFGAEGHKYRLDFFTNIVNIIMNLKVADFDGKELSEVIETHPNFAQLFEMVHEFPHILSVLNTVKLNINPELKAQIIEKQKVLYDVMGVIMGNAEALSRPDADLIDLNGLNTDQLSVLMNIDSKHQQIYSDALSSTSVDEDTNRNYVDSIPEGGYHFTAETLVIDNTDAQKSNQSIFEANISSFHNTIEECRKMNLPDEYKQDIQTIIDMLGTACEKYEAVRDDIKYSELEDIKALFKKVSTIVSPISKKASVKGSALNPYRNIFNTLANASRNLSSNQDLENQALLVNFQNHERKLIDNYLDEAIANDPEINRVDFINMYTERRKADPNIGSKALLSAVHKTLEQIIHASPEEKAWLADPQNKEIIEKAKAPYNEYLRLQEKAAERNITLANYDVSEIDIAKAALDPARKELQEVSRQYLEINNKIKLIRGPIMDNSPKGYNRFAFCMADLSGTKEADAANAEMLARLKAPGEEGRNARIELINSAIEKICSFDTEYFKGASLADQMRRLKDTHPTDYLIWALPDILTAARAEGYEISPKDLNRLHLIHTNSVEYLPALAEWAATDEYLYTPEIEADLARDINLNFTGSIKNDSLNKITSAVCQIADFYESQSAVKRLEEAGLSSKDLGNLRFFDAEKGTIIDYTKICGALQRGDQATYFYSEPLAPTGTLLTFDKSGKITTTPSEKPAKLFASEKIHTLDLKITALSAEVKAEIAPGVFRPITPELYDKYTSLLEERLALGSSPFHKTEMKRMSFIDPYAGMTYSDGMLEDMMETDVLEDYQKNLAASDMKKSSELLGMMDKRTSKLRGTSDNFENIREAIEKYQDFAKQLKKRGGTPTAADFEKRTKLLHDINTNANYYTSGKESLQKKFPDKKFNSYTQSRIDFVKDLYKWSSEEELKSNQASNAINSRTKTEGSLQALEGRVNKIGDELNTIGGNINSMPEGLDKTFAEIDFDHRSNLYGYIGRNLKDPEMQMQIKGEMAKIVMNSVIKKQQQSLQGREPEAIRQSFDKTADATLDSPIFKDILSGKEITNEDIMQFLEGEGELKMKQEILGGVKQAKDAREQSLQNQADLQQTGPNKDAPELKEGDGGFRL